MPEIIVKLGDNIVQNHLFTNERITIGRAPENDIVIENLAVSRNHAVITWENDRFYLEDLGSSNGSFINGVKVKRNEVVDRDVITIGKHKIYFYDRMTREPVRRAQPAIVEGTMIVQQSMVAELVVTKGRQKGQVFRLDGNSIALGRGGQNDIRLTDWFVSKNHAVIEKRGLDYYLVDLGSWRHTMLNGEVVTEAILNDGDVIQLGPTVQLGFQLQEHLEQMRPGDEAELDDDGNDADSVEDELDRLSESMQNEATRVLRKPVAPPETPPETPSASVEEEELDLEAELDELEHVRGLNGCANGSAAPGAATSPSPAEIDETLGAHDELDPPPADEILGAHDELDLPPADEILGAHDELDLPPAGDESPAPPVAEAYEVPPPSPAELALEQDEWEELETDEPLVAPLPSTGCAQEIAEATAIIPEQDPVAEMTAQPDLLAEAAEEFDHEPEPAAAEPPVAAAPTVDPLPADADVEREPAGADEPADAKLQDEVRMWERALTNKSPVIRKQAARMLKKLTGKDYEY